eukprot:s1562_g21.t1
MSSASWEIAGPDVSAAGRSSAGERKTEKPSEDWEKATKSAVITLDSSSDSDSSRVNTTSSSSDEEGGQHSAWCKARGQTAPGAIPIEACAASQMEGSSFDGDAE